jgi:hypothetical protein
MAISKSKAEGVIMALIACKASEMFEKIRGNQHSMEKHFSKQTAKAAASDAGYPQGYFKRVKNVVIKSSADLTRGGLKQKTIATALDLVGAKRQRDFGKKLGQGEIQVPEKSAASKDDILGLVDGVIRSSSCELRQSNDAPETRFLAVSPIPVGFYGRSIDAEGTKTKDCSLAVVVINAAATGNPQIVTIFPANTDYVGRCRLLS